MVRVLKNRAIMEAPVMVMDITHIRETLLVGCCLVVKGSIPHHLLNMTK
jgi:hypothetical protein